MNINEYEELNKKVKRFEKLSKEKEKLERKIKEINTAKDESVDIYIDFVDSSYFYNVESSISKKVYMAIINILETEVKEISSEMERL